MEDDALKTLSANLRALMDSRTPTMSQAKVASDVSAVDPESTPINQTTVGYVLRAEHSPRLDLVQKLAIVFGVEPWQMLAPRLGASLYRLEGKQLVPVMAHPPPEAVRPKRKGLRLATSQKDSGATPGSQDADVAASRKRSKRAERDQN